MATVNSTSTVEDLQAAYLDNVGYQEDGSGAMCKAFISVALAMLGTRPRGMINGPQQIFFDAVQLQKEIVVARRWLATSVAAGNRNTRYASLEGFRG